MNKKMTQAIEKFYLKNKSQPLIDHVVDFLIDQYSSKKSINFNYYQALEKMKQWEDSFSNVKPISKGVFEVVRDFGDYRICKLNDPDSKTWEGYWMKHCVGSSNYKNHEDIYSLRDKNDIPHCTIEISRENSTPFIKQIKGKTNGPVSKKYVSYVLDFLNTLDISVNHEEMNNIGYWHVSSDHLNTLYRLFPRIEPIVFKNHHYVYAFSKVEADMTVLNSFDFNEKMFFIDFLSLCPINLEVLKEMLQFDEIKSYLNYINDCFAQSIIHRKKDSLNVLIDFVNKDYQYCSFSSGNCFVFLATCFNFEYAVRAMLSKGFKASKMAKEISIQTQNRSLVDVLIEKGDYSEKMLINVANNQSFDVFKAWITKSEPPVWILKDLIVLLWSRDKFSYIEYTLDLPLSKDINYLELIKTLKITSEEDKILKFEKLLIQKNLLKSNV